MSESKSRRSHFFDLSKFLEDCFSGEPVDWQSHFKMNASWPFPLANTKETAEAFIVEIIAPGREKSDFSIKYQNGELRVNAEPIQETSEEGERYKRREFTFGNISRKFRFPKYEVEEKKIKAGYNQGVLKVTLPKRKEAESNRDTEIKVE